jgi:hypothetical protein
MYLPTAGGAAMTFPGEASGAGVTATSPCYCIAAPCNCPPFDQPPDISTLPIFGGGGTYPAETDPPIFRTKTESFDWFRLAFLALGVFIGLKVLRQ